MKFLKYSILIASLPFLGLTSCNDTVDLEPNGVGTIEVALGTLEGYEGSIIGAYRAARDPYQSNSDCMYKNANDDLIKGGILVNDDSDVSAQARLNGVFNSNLGTTTRIWNSYLGGLNLCNTILANIDNAPGVNPNNASQVARINVVKGEAYFFRAYFHYNLIVQYDNIPLVDTPPNPNASDFTVKPGDKAAIWALIESDLVKAKGLLPTTAAKNGKLTQDTAGHLLAKTYLWLGKNAEAAETAKNVIESGNHSLVALNQVFSENFQGNKEILLAWQFTKAEPGVNGEPTAARTAQQYIPLYDRVEGVGRTFEQGGRPWARLHPNAYYWTLFQTGDGRLAAWHKTVWHFDGGTPDVPEKLPAGVSLGDAITTANVGAASGYGAEAITPTTWKYAEGATLGRTIGDAYGLKEVVEFRLAETYLVAAEGYMRSGNNALALQYINKLRERAYGNSTHNFTFINQDLLLEEQARELGQEGKRWEILKRLNLLVDRVKLYNPTAGVNIQPYHVRWPIPRSFVQLTNFPQNEGYN
ncbi:RagB/SusD family nutrient uptake outer membrane protein [Cloacibacterium sp.]|uniref:RagB/SusD family nutrient uptake outer membrane protein n=1 Tax=Cloacibacterium sp. TaxID=1913682 RepID=UPI0039E384B1